MIVKKAGGKVYGAVLSSAEQKALDIEIKRQLAENWRKHSNEVEAMVLWAVHEKYGCGPKRLRDFYDTIAPLFEELAARYEMEDCDLPWLCTYKLKEYGIDIEEWRKNGGKQE